MKTKEQLLIQKSALEKMLKKKRLFEDGLCRYNQCLFGYREITENEWRSLYRLLQDLKRKHYASEYVWVPFDWEIRAKWLLSELKKVNKELRRREKIANFFGAIKGIIALNKMLKKWDFNNW